MKPRHVALAAILVGMLVFALKFVAFRLTGSVSLYSDALESIVNTVAALGAFFAIRIAARPPDRNHPFGHSKVEYFAAVAEGGLILFAAVEILRSASERFGSPAPLVELDTGIAISLAATGLNGLAAWYLVRMGKRFRSPALYADGRHLWSDVVTTLGVLVGILLAWATGLWILDPILAVAVALHIIWVGIDVIRSSLGGLMDESLSEVEVESVRTAINDHMGAALEVHDLKTRRAGGRAFVEFHLIVPGTMSVSESHDLCDTIEEAIRNQFPQVVVTVHVEPEIKAKGAGPVALVE
jgi:cation diffusion facilitator family transporter